MRAPPLTFALALWVACGAPAKKPVIPGTGGAVATTDTQLAGWAQFPPQHVDDPALKGKVRDLTSEADGELVKWSLAVEDNTEQRHSYAIRLPPQIALPIATGTTVTVTTAFTGGGQSTEGRIAIVDDQGTLLLAIGLVPEGWKAEAGGLVTTQADAKSFAVRITASDGYVDLVPSPWRSFDLAGSHYLGNGMASQREPHGDVQDGSVDGLAYAIVREP